jgi:hypothetical protein
MKKSIYSKWHVRLVLIIILVIAVYLTVEAIRKGYREGAEDHDVVPSVR